MRFQTGLLTWYAVNRRDLPWRRTRDPYAILVSEVMLQQTQVDRVAPKFIEFLRLFPDFPALAAAAPAEVIRAWAPLGYNQRAVRLQRLARRVVEEFGGRLPEGPRALRGLEGIGEYTAAAVSCLAQGADVAMIDTNVRRVLGRVVWGTRAPSPRELAAAAQQMVPPGVSRDWNQALMDLGASVCLSRKPSCPVCPLREQCLATPSLMNGLNGLRHAAEERAVYRTAPAPFKGSSRYYRGRILQHLRGVPPGETAALGDLGRAVKPDYAAADRDWLEGLVAGLEHDGLIKTRMDEGRVSLP